MVIPVWNACALLTDENYVYWAGRSVPALMISSCIGILTVYVVRRGSGVLAFQSFSEVV